MSKHHKHKLLVMPSKSPPTPEHKLGWKQRFWGAHPKIWKYKVLILCGLTMIAALVAHWLSVSPLYAVVAAKLVDLGVGWLGDVFWESMDE